MDARLIWATIGTFFITLSIATVGFLQLPHPLEGARDGVIAGITSAFLWAVGSISASREWANFFNFGAALFAALTVG
jgi:hypothetical protein